MTWGSKRLAERLSRIVEIKSIGFVAGCLAA